MKLLRQTKNKSGIIYIYIFVFFYRDSLTYSFSTATATALLSPIWYYTKFGALTKSLELKKLSFFRAFAAPPFSSPSKENKNSGAGKKNLQIFFAGRRADPHGCALNRRIPPPPPPPLSWLSIEVFLAAGRGGERQIWGAWGLGPARV